MFKTRLLSERYNVKFEAIYFFFYFSSKLFVIF